MTPFLHLDGGGYGYREKKPGVMSAAVVELDNPAKAIPSEEAFIDQRFQDDEEFRRKWRWRGNADSMSNSSPMFQANRMSSARLAISGASAIPQSRGPRPKLLPQPAG